MFIVLVTNIKNRNFSSLLTIQHQFCVCVCTGGFGGGGVMYMYVKMGDTSLSCLAVGFYNLGFVLIDAFSA